MTFLNAKGLNPNTLDNAALLETFIHEMEKGLRDQGDLPMIPSGLLNMG